MKSILLLTLSLTLGTTLWSQQVDWYYSYDGIDAAWTWEYKDIYIPTNVVVDSVYGGFQRPGSPAQSHDYIFVISPGPVFEHATETGPWSYSAVDTSLYGYWIDLTSFDYQGELVIRVALPVTGGGAIWDSLGIATHSIAGMENLEEKSKIKIYPNPTSDILNIYNPNGLTQAGEIIITTITGDIVLSVSQKTSSVDVSSLASGVYFIICNDGQEAIKFIKQ